MSLPFNKFWQPPTSLNLDTTLRFPSGSSGLGLNLNSFAQPKPKLNANSALGMIGGIGGGLMDLYNGINADTSSITDEAQKKIDEVQSISYEGASSLDDLMNRQASYRGLEANHKSSELFNAPSTGSIFGNALSKGASAALSASSASPIASAIAGGVSFLSSLAGGLIGRNKQQNAADSEAARINREERKKNAYMESAYRNDANNLVTKNSRALMSQIRAYGGPLGISLNPVNGAIDFMQNEELLDSLDDSLSKTNRRTSMPTFAFGGALGGYGGDWSNGLTYIGAGGTHEQNPLGGVPIGMSQDGQPNQAEEGEWIWNEADYVFSKRIEVPEEEYESLGLRKGKNKLTYADAAKALQKESEERPNDPISKRSKDVSLSKLMQSQEQQRALLAQQEQQEQIEYAMGGGLDRDKDYGSKKKPYPKVKSKDFAGEGRSYPIPTKADAIDALRLAGLHGRSDVKAKVYKKYPELKHSLGGHLFGPGGRKNPYGNMFTNNQIYVPDSSLTMPSLNTNFNIEDWYKNYQDNQNSSIFKQVTSINKTPNFNFGSYDFRGRWIPPTNFGITYTGMDGKKHSTADITTSTENENKPDFNLPTSGWQTGLRYVPILGAGLGLAHSLANKPDYSYADELSNLAGNYENQVSGIDVQPTYLGDYLAYNPFDRIFYANELGAQQAGANRLIGDMGNGNYGRTMASLLASNYNNNVAMGKLFREGDEYNLNQRHKVAEFNRGTNQFNAEADLKAQLAKAAAKKAAATVGFEGKAKALAMKQAIDQAREQAIMANATNLFQGLGDVGNEAEQRYWLNALINSGVFGTPNESMFDIAYGKRHAAKGGKLNRNKKRGLTI